MKKILPMGWDSTCAVRCAVRAVRAVRCAVRHRAGGTLNASGVKAEGNIAKAAVMVRYVEP